MSHHPPISACIAESPNYRYFGEVDAKNKFLGKSFEIRPTGMAHCELRLSPEAAPDMPTDPLGLVSFLYLSLYVIAYSLNRKLTTMLV